MDYKTKTRRLKSTAWVAFMLPFVAVGASLISRQAQAKPIDDVHNHEHVCGDSTPRAPYPYTGYDASNIDYYEQPKFVVDYFRNLVENLPTNNSGNCGYTALTMLLSYYDTYWNSGIIPDQYNNPWDTYIDSLYDRDYSSPGVIDIWRPVWTQRNPEPVPGKPDYEEKVRNAYFTYVYEEMLPLADFNIISKLYEMALNEKPFPNIQYPSNFHRYPLWDFDADPTPGTNLSLLHHLANIYFNEFGLANKATLETRGYWNFFDYDDDDKKRYMLRLEAIERLKRGQPLIIQGVLHKDRVEDDPYSTINTANGHIAIAYAYDERNDAIIGHMGWKKTDFNEAVLEKMYDTIDGFAYLNVKGDMTFSHPNVRFTGPSGESWCAYDLDTHCHGERAMIPYDDGQYHALQCVCGDVMYERHTMTTTYYDGLRHLHECPCGFTKLETHHLRLSGMMHMTCTDCGFTTLAGQFPQLIYNP